MNEDSGQDEQDWKAEHDEAVRVAQLVKGELGGIAMINHNDLVVQVCEAVGRNDVLRGIVDQLVTEFRDMRDGDGQIWQGAEELSSVDLSASVVLGVVSDMADALEVPLVWSVHAPTNSAGQLMLNVVVSRMHDGSGVAVQTMRKALHGMQQVKLRQKMRGMINLRKRDGQEDKHGE